MQLAITQGEDTCYTAIQESTRTEAKEHAKATHARLKNGYTQKRKKAAGAASLWKKRDMQITQRRHMQHSGTAAQPKQGPHNIKKFHMLVNRVIFEICQLRTLEKKRGLSTFFL